MTAHPRYDHDTGELHFFGYEAGGLATRDVAYCIADRDGTLVHEEWFEAPYCGLMHDFVITKEHVIFPVFPTTADLDRIKAGGAHWVWEPDLDTFIGIMPRGGSTRDLRWFRGPAMMVFHFMNAFTDGDRVHLDCGYANVNQFPFIREASGIDMNPADMRGTMSRWTFDLSGRDDGFTMTDLGPVGDLPRVAEKDHMRDYEIGYYETFDPAFGPPIEAGPVGVGFNAILRIQVKTGKLDSFCPGPRTTVQEPVHIPSRQAGHEGYLAFVVDLHDQWLSEVLLLEAAHVGNGPVARIKVPLRLRNQVHGNWYALEQLGA